MAGETIGSVWVCVSVFRWRVEKSVGDGGSSTGMEGGRKKWSNMRDNDRGQVVCGQL